MRKPPAMGARAFLAVLTVFVATACLDEEAIYDDAIFPDDPPSAAQGFLGYSDHAAQLTVCGNCHEGLQHQWEETAHASAWATIETVGSADPACTGCHSVNERGNDIATGAGYNATQDERYEDVQCESCHGPGLEHALDPTSTNAPLPTTMEDGLNATTGCGECHRGDDQPYLNEWVVSRHGTINVFPANQEGTCDQCHTGEGAMNRLGISFRNFDQADYTGRDNHMAITCLICHDPHNTADDALLRFPVNVPSIDGNLCMSCHNERAVPDPMNERQPHAPSAALLLGTAGYWSPATPRSTVIRAHGDASVNERLCATCHMNQYTTEGGAYESAGHTFAATPCLDADGRPLTTDECESSERMYEGCATSGCHSDGASARSAQEAARVRLDALSAALRELLEDVPSDEFDDQDEGLTVAEGARFNAQLADRRGTEVHNPALVELLLLGAIDAVEQFYGVSAHASLVRTPLFKHN